MDIDPKNIKNILLIKFLQIGDVLLITPTIKAFSEAFPNAKISVAVYKHASPVLEGNPHICEIFTIDIAWKNLPFFKRLREEFRIIREIRKRKFNIAVNLVANDRGSFLAFLSRAKIKVGQKSPRRKIRLRWNEIFFNCFYRADSPYTHWIEKNLESIRCLGFEPKVKNLEISIDSETEKSTKYILKENGRDENKLLIHVHPTARIRSKYWNDYAFANVIDSLIREGFDVVVTSGTDQVDTVKNILGLTKNAPINLAGKTSLKHIAAISKEASLFIGVDSAPMHIAAAVKTPIIALFGPMEVELWRPLNSGSIVFVKNMPCQPCGRNGCNGTGRSKCLEEIPYEIVLQKAKEMLKCLKNNLPDYSSVYYIN